VAMVSLARGNVPVAIFNATLSSLLGVFITPVLMAWYMQNTGTPIPLLPTVMKVVLLVLLPIVIGQIARSWLHGWAQRNNRWIKLADRAVILAIVYSSFADSVAEGIWSQQSPLLLAEIIGGAIMLFLVVYNLTRLVILPFDFDRDDTIACLFCASKKSLATGVPLAPVIFGHTPELGLYIAPIMLFHFFQLLIVSFIANGYANQREAHAPA